MAGAGGRDNIVDSEYTEHLFYCQTQVGRLHCLEVRPVTSPDGPGGTKSALLALTG